MRQQAQFIIVTHSLIVLAHPGAAIIVFDGATITETPYDAVETKQPDAAAISLSTRLCSATLTKRVGN